MLNAAVMVGLGIELQWHTPAIISFHTNENLSRLYFVFLFAKLVELMDTAYIFLARRYKKVSESTGALFLLFLCALQLTLQYVVEYSTMPLLAEVQTACPQLSKRIHFQLIYRKRSYALIAPLVLVMSMIRVAQHGIELHKALLDESTMASPRWYKRGLDRGVHEFQANDIRKE